MKNSLCLIFSTIFIFILGSTMAQTADIETLTTDEATASAVEASEQKKKTKKMSVAAREMYQIETNQAAAMIRRYMRKHLVYPPAYQDSGMEREVIIDFFIDRQGMIRQMKIMQGGPAPFNDKILESLDNLKEVKIRHYLGANRIRVPVNFSLQ